MRVQRFQTNPTSTPDEQHIKRNLSLSRTILFYTSPTRILTSRSFSIALRATLRLSSSLPALRRASVEPWHFASVSAIETNLKQARVHAARKANTVPLAHDVFALLCGFLGADGRPQKALNDDKLRKKKEKEEQKAKEIAERAKQIAEKANRPPGAFSRVASGILKSKETAAMLEAKRKFGQSISYAGPLNRRGFYDGDDDFDDYEHVDDSQDSSETTDDFFGRDGPKIAVTRVKSVRFVEPEKDRLPLKAKAAVQKPPVGGPRIRRSKSNYSDYFSIRISDVDSWGPLSTLQQKQQPFGA